VREWFCLDKTPFNWREAQAESFAGIANRATMRTDKPDLPPVVASDGNIPLDGARPLILPLADRGADAAKPGIVRSISAMTKTTRVPKIAPVAPPEVRKPTDLVMQMAKAMEYSLGLVGAKTRTNTHQIYSAQDADTYLKQAHDAVMQRGR
jgi:hypothetical protein